MNAPARILDYPAPAIDAADAPPHSEDAERAVLGACLLDRGAIERVRKITDERDFFVAAHRTIWRGIVRVDHEDQAPDVLTVAEALRAADELEGVGGLAYLQGLASATPSAANAATYAGIVARLARQRELAGHLAELHRAALAPGADLGELRESVAEAIANAPSRHAPRVLDLAALAEIEPSLPQSIMPGLPIGYATMLAGHGGAGKSLIALYLAVCVASGRPFFGLEVQRRRVRYLSCEDREPVLHWRLARICAHLGIDLASLKGWLVIEDLVGREATLWAA
ncbi:MAG: DnaB-like helicase N-terminal domain-containing protein [Steroidobacteraceae bacterium]